ncbi:MAG TPA: PilZ domain-containing protein [Pyrinomonadaceae bacterium]
MGTIEQRRHPRINVDFFADWGWGPEYDFYDRVTSLSLSGCFLVTTRDLASGQEIYLKWTAERAGTITLRGEVRYLLRVMEGAPPTGAGIEFVNVSEDIRKRLNALMENFG